MLILVTGGGGFVGRRLCLFLAELGHRVVSVQRRPVSFLHERVKTAVVDDLCNKEALRSLLAGVDAVVHLAARAHVLRETAGDSLAAFRHTNVEGTTAVASTAGSCRVRRFVYISSVGVHGRSSSSTPFTEVSPPNPEDAYALSKLEGEATVIGLARDNGMEVVIIRPPLVHGPGVKGNFLRLLDVAGSGIPLPVSGCRAARSLIGVDNLCALIEIAVRHPAAAGEVLLAADEQDLSTAELIRLLRRLMKLPPRMFWLPEPALRLTATVTGRLLDYRRLTEPLQVDSTRARRLLGWKPVRSAEEGLADTVAWYLAGLAHS